VNRDELKGVLLDELNGIAPEIDVAALIADKPLRNQVDLDSVDWLNFLVALHGRLRIEIPDADARKLTTLDKLIAYCAQKLGI
jgi:acyl carrier protein